MVAASSHALVDGGIYEKWRGISSPCNVIAGWQVMLAGCGKGRGEPTEPHCRDELGFSILCLPPEQLVLQLSLLGHGQE